MIATSGKVPVTAGDRLSDVLARDEALVEVFVRHAPHFARLRNRTMRRIMARLVTVEQAARTAQVPVERLVDDLNAALGFPGDAARPATPAAPAATRHHPSAATVVDLDLREDLRAGREPFSRIMSAVGALRDDDVLQLRTTFEPVPLFAALAKRGFEHEAEAHAPDDWVVWFWRPGDGRTTYLDVRGLTPPEPMLRTLAALESLPVGHTLAQINNRVPEFLLPVLAERGYTYAIDASQADRVLVRISRT